MSALTEMRQTIVAFCAAALILTIALMPAFCTEAFNQDARAQPAPTAAEVLRATMKALAGVSTVEYEVRLLEDRTLYGSNVKFRATTKIVAAGAPLRAVSKLQAEDGKVYEVAVLDDKTLRLSSQGEVTEHDMSKGFPPATTLGDLNTTWRLLLDKNYFDRAIESGQILYGGVDDIEGDLCHVIVHVTSNPALYDTTTNYYWLSQRTSLPRAVQTFKLFKGRSITLARRIITITKLNPSVAPDTFAYRPTGKDSVPPSAMTANDTLPVKDEGGATRTAAFASLVGHPLLDATVQDMSYKTVRLRNFIGKPTLITFWATWCAPCLGEMPTLQKLLDKHRGSFQVLAVAASDTRVDSINFIKKNPQYKFVFLLDPDWQADSSRLKDAFGITAFPTNLLVNAEGKVVDAWRGERSPEELTTRIEKVLIQ